MLVYSSHLWKSWLNHDITQKAVLWRLPKHQFLQENSSAQTNQMESNKSNGIFKVKMSLKRDVSNILVTLLLAVSSIREVVLLDVLVRPWSSKSFRQTI